MLKDIPQYECLLEAARHYPTLEPSAHEACLHLLRTADLVTEDSQRFFNKHHISQSRFTVLMLLHRPWVKVRTPASLADDAGVTRATMTGLIDTLEKDGMVTRRPDPQDRRITQIELTELGRATLDAIIPECFTKIARMLAPLDADERRQFVALLQKIEAGLTSGEPNGNAEAPGGDWKSPGCERA